ncbi:MAG: PilN domain-containing protein [Desulfuromonadales bacterium]|nr:PilN domain-containing protein [Desulfuromonadales bacterium]
MSKRLIGIEIGHSTLRVAILNQEKGQVSVGSLLERGYTDSAELTAQLQELLAGEFRIGDQLVTSLPARTAYVRSLEFPFQDDKKIAAAIPFSLSTQLPVAIDNCATAIQPVQPVDKGATVVAAAVPRETLQSLLGPFEEADVPLHLVDLAPFCHVAGLGEQIGDGLLICATGQETTVSLVQKGTLADYRILPAIAVPAHAAQFQQLLREIRVLKHAAGEGSLSISMMGERSNADLAEALQASGLTVEMLSLELGGQIVEGAFLPAVALALRARVARHERAFNFRRGQYALKGEWANLKRKLVLLAALLGMAVLIMLGSMALRYVDEAGRAGRLQTEMVNVYRSLFPGATTIVDVPLQLKSAIRDLQEKGNLITGGQVSAIAVLREISRLPELVTSVEVQELSLSSDEIKMAGRTASFEGVNQMTRVLGESPMFTRVQVTDAKMSLDGSRIDFRLLLSLANPGAEQ